MATFIKVIVFVAASAGIAWLSRSAIRNVRSHGFPRFLAWESILAIILLNINHWFHDPCCLHQIVSWFMLTTSAYLVLHGAWLLRRFGVPDSGRDDPSLIGIEKTTVLVTAGIYRYVRHPIYSSLLFLAWGVFFKSPSWAGLSLATIATVCLTVTARVEDIENIKYFGLPYRNQMKRTRMFIPFLF